MINEYNIHNHINSLKKIFYLLIIQNIADISNKLIFYYVFKFMKKKCQLKTFSRIYKCIDIKYNTILLNIKVF